MVGKQMIPNQGMTRRAPAEREMSVKEINVTKPELRNENLKNRPNEDKDNFYISLEVPGVKKEDVKINLEDNTLTISGTKNKNEEFKDKTVIRNERYYGEFKRTFNLTNEIKKDSIEAKYADGVLHIMLPKVEEAKPVVKEITIK